MRVLYLTTSLCEDDFDEFAASWRISLNSSNQNFNNKMIRAISKRCSVDVISLRPYSRTKCRLPKLYRQKTIKGNITYHYLAVARVSLLRGHSFKKQALKLLKLFDLKDTIIVSDTINPKAIKIANVIKKKFNLPLIGICTDSPSNISGTSRSYTMYLFNQTKHLDGYISLTKELDSLFNQGQKPSLTIEGLVEEKLPPIIENKYGKYFFFGGALMKRYGVYELIDSFKKLPQKDVNLLICGHHCDEEAMSKAIRGDGRIHYLKCLPTKTVLQLEMNALANINPRPFSEDLDRFSIPSKTLEYLASGKPVISVKNTKLQKRFNEEIIWSKTASEEDLFLTFNRFFELTEKEKEELGNKGKEKVQSLYSLSVVGEQVYAFLLDILK